MNSNPKPDLSSSFKSSILCTATINERGCQDDHKLHDLFSIASSNRFEVRRILDERSRGVCQSPPISTTFDGEHEFIPEEVPSSPSILSNNVLDNPNVAPPPEMVSTCAHQSISRFHNIVGLPSYTKICHSGFIMTRFDKTSLLIRKWRQTFWIFYDNGLHFFQSKEDFKWLMNKFVKSYEKSVKQMGMIRSS